MIFFTVFRRLPKIIAVLQQMKFQIPSALAAGKVSAVVEKKLLGYVGVRDEGIQGLIHESYWAKHP